MRKRLIIPLITMSILLTGCSSFFEEKSAEATESVEDIDPMLIDEKVEMKKLEENSYYVRHANGTYEKLYFGEASFEKGNTTSYPDTNRIMWFKTDFDEIPTFHQGDSLIYYTKEQLKEEFNLERFKDLGYSIGIRGLEETISGRYKISTDVEKKHTYPMGDTDEILLIKNKEVIVDYISGAYIRKNENTSTPLVSEYGTINNLTENSVYDVKVYEGTEEHDYKFTCDVRILGSMEVERSTDFDFAEGNFVVINIPMYYHSGYYLVNGEGIFRYVTSENFDVSANSKDMFNVANVPEENEGTLEVANDATVPTAIDKEESTTGTLTNENGQDVSVFNVEDAGNELMKIYIKFTNSNQVEADKKELPEATLVDPNGDEYQFFSYNEGLYLEIDTATVGKYTIKYKHLGNYIPNFTVSGVDLERKK